jgi:branched-subunit amino acid aminotransferase/4-amino-4-deoxychorismate lyase
LAAGRGCFTSARAVGGRVCWVERHVRRLTRDALCLGLPAPDPTLCRRLLEELAAPSRVRGDLKVRVEAHADAKLGVRLRGAATELDPDRPAWRAVAGTHPGPSPTSAVKSTDRAIYDVAIANARAAGADEALLFDAAGLIVEGARTNVIVHRAEGLLVTPPLARGGQAGIAREILLEKVPELCEDDVSVFDLRRAREVIAVNAVRGARAITWFDGHTIGGGRTGPWCERLAGVLSPDA